MLSEARRQWQEEAHRELKGKLKEMQQQVDHVRENAGNELASTAAQYAAALEKSNQQRTGSRR